MGHLTAVALFRSPDSLTKEQLRIVTSQWHVVAEFTRRSELLRAASRGQFEIVMFSSIGEFLAEEKESDGVAALSRLALLNVRIVSLREPEISTEGESGRTLTLFLKLLAKAHKTRVGKHIVEGQHRARAVGKALGRPRKKIDRRLLRRLSEAGNSVREIAARAGISKSTVQRSLAGVRNRRVLHKSPSPR